MSRKYTVPLACAAEGCKERSFFFTDTQARQRELYAERATWRCTRHTRPNEVLSPERSERTHVLESYEVVSTGGGTRRRFWRAEGPIVSSGSGFVYGPGFKAFADDFPPGTRLVITARIELTT